ncbi:MAG: hypothetical protein HY883_03615 [Deltaproteobacteria bacterium]|nr:hypothetical protein [Deltaproteobacteria bacterium]
MKKTKTKDSNQLNLFDVIKRLSAEAKEQTTQAGSFNVDARARALLSDALKTSPLSRELVAGRMSELTGMEITKSQLDSWTAESKENHRFPFVYAAAFCEASGNVEILRLASEMCGCYLLKGEDALLTELGRIEQTKEKLAKKEKLIRETLNQLGFKKERSQP